MVRYHIEPDPGLALRDGKPALAWGSPRELAVSREAIAAHPWYETLARPLPPVSRAVASEARQSDDHAFAVVSVLR